MPPRSPKPAPAPLVLVCGSDEFVVKRRARELYQEWCAELGGMAHETIDATAANGGEALRCLARLREALQTLPFFGDAKAVWFQNCNFLGDERAADSQAVSAALASLADELKAFPWDNVRLLVSAGKVDKRKTLYRTFESLGRVEILAGLALEDKDWVARAEQLVVQEFQTKGKRIEDEALGELVTGVGPHPRQLSQEVEKLSLFVGERSEVSLADVEAVVTRNKQARAFALGDALGDRDLPRLLRTLDEEFWELKLDRQKSPIGLLYGLISKVRVLILVKEMMRLGWLKAEADYQRFKAQLARLPADRLPTDKRYNPQAINSYVLFKAVPQAGRYRAEELVEAMERLLTCNQRLVGSGLDETLVLQQTLVQIVGRRA